ncbi:MAG: hypothetical protein M3245_05065, partial [Actinomycetota bacterium]|nr:hypothetical protein [Actinomycetota bacterium]
AGVRWTGHAAFGYDLQASASSRFRRARIITALPGERLRVRARPGSPLCVRVRGFDDAGGVSGWSAPACTNGMDDDRTLVRRGGWTSQFHQGYLRGSASVAARRGARLLLPGARGRRFALLASTCRTCGRVLVTLGGTPLGMIDLRSGKLRRSVVFPLRSFSSVRSGTLRIQVLSNGRPVRIDGVGVARS